MYATFFVILPSYAILYYTCCTLGGVGVEDATGIVLRRLGGGEVGRPGPFRGLCVLAAAFLAACVVPAGTTAYRLRAVGGHRSAVEPLQPLGQWLHGAAADGLFTTAGLRHPYRSHRQLPVYGGMARHQSHALATQECGVAAVAGSRQPMPALAVATAVVCVAAGDDGSVFNGIHHLGTRQLDVSGR